jgi:hypothetical protein
VEGERTHLKVPEVARVLRIARSRAYELVAESKARSHMAASRLGSTRGWVTSPSGPPSSRTVLAKEPKTQRACGTDRPRAGCGRGLP